MQGLHPSHRVQPVQIRVPFWRLGLDEIAAQASEAASIKGSVQKRHPTGWSVFFGVGTWFPMVVGGFKGKAKGTHSLLGGLL